MRRSMIRSALLLVALAALSACGGGGGGKSAPPNILVRGGQGLAGAGGKGGIASIGSMQGGNIVVSPTGTAPLPPALVEPDSPDLGLNPRTISADATIESSTFPILGDDGSTPATGLHVKQGKTLTLVASTGDAVALVLTDGLIIEGAVRSGPLAGGEPASLQLEAESVLIGRRGRVDASGASTAGAGDGFPAADASVFGLHGVVNLGTVLARGGDGGSSGTGGEGGLAILVVPEAGALINRGVLDASGGAGAQGGAAGAAVMTCNPGDGIVGEVSSSGEQIARGGSGTGGGGTGGAVTMTGCGTGSVSTSGTVDASGGDATQDGAGGAAGSIVLDSIRGHGYVAGHVMGRGGKGAGAGAGAKGAVVQVIAAGADGSTESLGVASTAEVDLSGGDGATGGDGGTFAFADQKSERPGVPGDTVVIYGPVSIDASGGQGSTDGGDSGIIQITSQHNDVAGQERIGSVTVATKLIANGGQGLNGKGGDAQYMYVGTDTSSMDSPSVDRAVTVTGAVEALGGQGTAAGGKGGQVSMHEHHTLNVQGRIDASGGKGGTGAGGGGGYVVMDGDDVVTTPVIVASGGDSQSGQGGDGGTAAVEGQSVTVQAVTVDGGAGLGSVAGGDGGTVVIAGPTSTEVAGICSVRKGAGPAGANDGQVVVNGVLQTLTDGQYKP